MSLSPEMYEKAEELFQLARELGGEEREIFLQDSCSDMGELLSLVKDLLTSHELLEKESTSVQPEWIGPYRIVRSLGEGGMGSVYEAEQQKPIRRTVALKLIKRGMDTDEVVARFEAERQALAWMDHPNIAKVFDAGSTGDGRPYFVMELVRGSTITEYCDENQLKLDARIELFVQVVDGIQHAHQKGIIHRDIKPSNVIVAEDEKGRAVPRIIDFGISKSLDRPLTEHETFTQMGQIVGTPEYMSPEQAEFGKTDVDTRTDIYSLGVLLYELLVGRVPLGQDLLFAGGFLEMPQRIATVEPAKPSARVSILGASSIDLAARRGKDSRSLIRELRGDLDSIALKAMEKEPARRYSSASELAADLRRHLRNEPILARPPSSIYRLRKFGRRHRRAIALVAGIAVFAAAILLWMDYSQLQDRIRLAEGLIEDGETAWRDYLSQDVDLKRSVDEWRQERDRIDTWAPVWERQTELRFWEACEAERSDVERLINRSLTALYRAFEAAPGKTALKRRAQHAIQERLRDRGLQFLGVEFFGVLFERSGFDTYRPDYDAKILRLTSQPEGAEVHVFRYQSVEGRLQPLPLGTREKATAASFLEIGFVGDTALPFRVGDRIFKIGDRSIAGQRDLISSLKDVSAGETIAVTCMRWGKELTIGWMPFSGEKPASMINLRDSLKFDIAAYPLDVSGESLIGVTPLEVKLPEGSYLLLLRRDGHEDVRLPVAIPFLDEAEARPRLVRLPGRGTIPDGFVYIPAGPFRAGADGEVDQPLESGSRQVDEFCMARHEVTCGQYLAFLNDLTARSVCDESGLVEPRSPWIRKNFLERTLQIVPISGLDGTTKLFPFRDDHWMLGKSLEDPDFPVVGISLLAASEYAHWYSETHPGEWTFQLPSDEQWEKAARGSDGRYYVWGNYVIWPFCRAAKGNRGKVGRIGVVGAYPIDESVYGVRDLAGSIAEPTTGITDDIIRSLRGGDWRNWNDYFFRAANRNGRLPTKSYITQGMRLVAMRRGEPAGK